MTLYIIFRATAQQVFATVVLVIERSRVKVSITALPSLATEKPLTDICLYHQAV